MTDTVLPALNGREALGFLAALGAFRMCSEELDGEAVRLRFDSSTARAVVSADALSSVDDVVEVVSTVSARLDDGQVPDLPEDFPPPGEAPDRLRIPPAGIRELPNQWAGRADPKLVRRWLRALITDLVTDDQGRSAITPYAAPSGRMSFSTTFIKNRDWLRTRPAALQEAFVGWRRVAGCTGEYLDHRVLVSSADAGDGRVGGERGVPGATWLALMALPLLPVTGVGGRALAVGWQRDHSGLVLRWPLWSKALDLACASALLAHPALELYGENGSPRPPVMSRLQGFGVFAIGRAYRQRVRGRNFAGVLAPLPDLPLRA